MIIEYYENPNGEYKQQTAWLTQRDNQQGWPWGTSLQSQLFQRLRQEDHLNPGVKSQLGKQNETLSQNNSKPQYSKGVPSTKYKINYTQFVFRNTGWIV